MIARRRLLFSLLLCAAAPAPAFASGKEKTEDGKDGKGGGSPFVELPTLTAVAIRADGRRGVLTVQASLDIPDAAKRAKTQKVMPRLIDAYVTTLQAWAYQMIPGSLPNVALMGRNMQQTTDRVLGPGAKVVLGGVMLT